MKTYLETLIGFLAGAAWSLAIIFSTKLFLSFIHLGIPYAILAGLIGFVCGLFLVILVELFSLQIKKLRELEKQTKLLEEISKKLNKEND